MTDSSLMELLRVNHYNLPKELRAVKSKINSKPEPKESRPSIALLKKLYPNEFLDIKIAQYTEITDYCHNWIGAVSNVTDGICKRPSLHFNSKHINVARYILTKKLGREIRPNLLALHVCVGNSLCINPDHLYEGSFSDNTKDAYKAGRYKRFRTGEILGVKCIQ